jgi:hypothetical protein
MFLPGGNLIREMSPDVLLLTRSYTMNFGLWSFTG